MNNLVIRYITVLATIFVVGWLYSLLAVPMIEGTVSRSDSADVADLPGEEGPREHRFDLAQLLPADAWELGSCIRLDTRQGQLLFKRYEQLEDGRLEVSPLTVILDSGDDAEASANPVIMRTQESAVLRFTEAFTFGSSTASQLKSTWLKGEVRIFRKPSQEGDDGLSIVTSNISVDQQQLTAPGNVEFQFGPHFGRGRQLTLQLVANSDPYASKSSMALGGDLGLLELVHLDHMVLVPPADTLTRIAGDQPKSSVPAGQASADSRIVIDCSGPFRFDFQSLEASFNDDVDVAHMSHLSNLVDRLSCDVLKARFGERKEGSNGDPASQTIENRVASAEAEGSAADRMKNLELHALEAYGQPAILDLPNHRGRAQAEMMIYEPVTGRIYLKDGERVKLIHEEHQIEGLELEYLLTEDGRLGNTLAFGPGRIARVATTEQAGFEASWTEELRIRPDTGSKAISLYGSTHLQLGHEQTFDSHDLHLWIDEVPVHAPSADDPNKVEWKLVPTKMLATGLPSESAEDAYAQRGVRFDSPRMAAQTDRLEVFFTAGLVDQESNAATPATEPSNGGDATFGSQGSMTPLPISMESGGTDTYVQRRPQQKLSCSGNLTRLRLTPSGKDYQIEELTVGGLVRIREVVTESPEDLPLEIHGNVLQATSRGAEYFYVVIQGAPETDAWVSARGLSLFGQQINLDQLANQVWIDGPGNARLDGISKELLELNRLQPDLAEARGRFSKPTSVVWQDRMVFDGEKVQVDGNVEASGTRWALNGERSDWAAESGSMAFVLDRRVDLADPEKQKKDSQAQLARIQFEEHVELLNDSFDSMGILNAQDRLNVPNLSIDQITGEVLAVGAGTATSTRVGDSGMWEQPLATAAPTEEDDKEDGLTYLDIEFAAGIAGNIHRREVHFVRNVDALVGSVQQWGETLDRLAPLHGKESEQARMLCDRLIVAQWGEDSGGRPMVEVQAVGNAFIAGNGFEATAAKVAFNQLQNMIILEGDQHAYAKLLRKINGVGTGDFAEAMKIVYWRAQDRIDVDGARTINATYSGRLSPPRQMENR